MTGKSFTFISPDGTAVTVAAVSDDIGEYHADYVVTQAGRYEVVIVDDLPP